jgi:hypothetical protein
LFNSSASGAGAPPTIRSDADFRQMLSTMVHEANFLVENNLRQVKTTGTDVVIFYMLSQKISVKNCRFY